MAGDEAMGRLSINIPDEMADYAERQVHEGRFESMDAFFERLIHFDQKERPLTLKELHDRLDKAEASGVSNLSLPEIVAATKAELKANGRL